MQIPHGGGGPDPLADHMPSALQKPLGLTIKTLHVIATTNLEFAMILHSRSPLRKKGEGIRENEHAQESELDQIHT